MATTTNYGWTTPALSGANNPPADLTSLASQVDSTIKAHRDPLVNSWTSSFTPAWSGGGSLSIGNGTLTCRYREVGKTVEAQFFLERGSTTDQGSGPYSWTLPVAARAYREVTGSGVICRGSTYWPVSVVGVAAGAIGLLRTDNNSRVSHTSPGSWTTGDWLSWSCVYERG